MTRVLITGSRGLIGGVLRRELENDYDLVGLDVRREGIRRTRTGDMTKLESITASFANQDVVIDLAADSSATAGWDAVHRNNLVATFNALEASRQAGVRRVIFASSNHVTGLYERDHPYASIVAGRYEEVDRDAMHLIGPDDPIRPDGLYAVSKAFGEATGRLYSEEHGLSVICLRIGTVSSADRPRSARHFATLLTHADLVRLVRAAIEAPSDVRFAIVYGVSNNSWRFWDLESARASIGYVPMDDAETWR